MRTGTGLFSVLCGVLALSGAAVQAQTVGYTLVLTEHPQFGFNAADFILTNTSTAAEITGLTLRLGDPDFNFDYAAEGRYTTGSGTFNVVTPDTVDDGLRDDKIVQTFGGFAPGETFRFSGDIDRNGAGNTIEDARQVLFNNGAAPNSTFQVSFSNGQQLLLTFPDGPTADTSYTFSQMAPVPAPSSLALFAGGGLPAMSLLLRRRRK